MSDERPADHPDESPGAIGAPGEIGAPGAIGAPAEIGAPAAAFARPHAGRSTALICAMLIAAATLATYGRLCAYDFTNWDDNDTVWANKLLLPPTGSSLWKLWSGGPRAHIFTPLTWTLWWALAKVAVYPVPPASSAPATQMTAITPTTAISSTAAPATAAAKFALDPHVFHTANVLLHVATSLAVFALLRRLLATMRRREIDGRAIDGCAIDGCAIDGREIDGREINWRDIDWPACAGTAIFALHPVQVETVGWVSGTKDLLAGLLATLALLQYVRYATAASPHARTRRYALTVALSVAAMLAKPSAVALPLIVAATDWLLLRPNIAGRRAVDVVRGVVPLLLFVAPCLLWSRGSQTAAGLTTLSSPLLRPLVAADALAFYLWKLVWPARLAVDYGRFPKIAIASGEAWLTWIAPVAVGVAAWVLRRRLPEIATGLAIFVAALLPVLGMVPFDFQQYSTVADHYLYVAMIGVSLAAAGSLCRMSAARGRAAIIGAAAMVVIALAARSFDQARHWRDSISVFERAIDVNPRSWLGYNNLAEVWGRREDFARAEVYARKSTLLNPEDLPAHMNLGVALLNRDDIAGATSEFDKAVRLQPGNTQARINLAMAYARADRMDEAIAQYRMVCEMDPHNPIARNMLDLALAYRQDLLRKRATQPATSPADRPRNNERK